MRLVMVAIHDVKSQCYARPMCVRAFGEAERSFTEVLNDGKSDFAKHPADFTLFHVGFYEDGTGTVEALPAPVSLGNGVNFIVQDPRQLSLLKAEG